VGAVTRPGNPYRPQSVRNTPELQRVLTIPRRRLADQPSLAAELTDLLRTPTGTMRLREVQGQALQEIGTQGGLFGPIGVGEGKTLITLLAPYILDAKRPLLLLPAGLIEKTNRERAKLAQHWRIPTNLRLMSYEILGRVQSVDVLEEIRKGGIEPDLIICDEVHKLKNRRAAVTRRVIRWMHEHPDTRFVALSGTIMRKSLTDFAHILRWCLKDNAPVPRTVEETEEWALALDDQVSDEARFDPGALLRFTTPEDGDEPTTAARRGFQRRLLETPGVVSATQGERVDCSIYVRAKPYEMSRVTSEHVLKLRTDMVTPDDWELMTGAEVWMHARQLALGFHSIWSPRPPEPWRRARKAWNRFVRDVLSRSRTLDSPDHVARAIDDGRLPEGKAVLDAWRAIRDTFRPNVVAVWHDDSALKVCAEWMRKPGVVWTEHVPFAERLAQMTGAQYFGAKGLTSRGESIEDEKVLDPRRSIIASIDANREGRNLLTRWNRMLMVSPSAGSDEWQQSIARLHRPGQTADEVEIDVLLGCLEHADAFRKAYAGAEVVRDTMGEEQKLLLADITWPSDNEIASYRGPLWGEKKSRKAGVSTSRDH
jgi:hypothetical protein